MRWVPTFFPQRLGHESHEALTLVSIQFVHNEQPFGPGVAADPVAAMSAAKSSSVRVGPMVGLISSPLVTSKLPINVCVPCRAYSTSDLRRPSGLHRHSGRDALERQNACHLVNARFVRLFRQRTKQYNPR